MIGDWEEWEPKLPTFDYPGHTLNVASPVIYDPYAGCEGGCSHDKARAVTLDQLLGGDGPYPTELGLQPPLGGAGRLLDGLRSQMPNLLRTETSTTP